MAAASTDKVRKKKSNFSTTLSSGINDTVATIPISSSSGLPSDTAVTLTIDRVDANAVSTPSLMERVTGVVGVNQLTTATRGVEGTAQSHSAGAVVEDIWEAATWNDLCTAFLVSHNQAGGFLSGSVFTVPQINDTSSDHQYVFAVNELAADRTVTLPLLLSADTFVFADFIQTLKNKTLEYPVIASQASANHNHQNVAGGGTLAEAALALTDVTTWNVTNSAHGFVPKATGNTANFLRADGQYAAPTGGQATIIAPNTVFGSGSATTSGTTELDIVSQTITNPSAAGQIFISAYISVNTPTVANDFFIYKLYFAGAAIATVTKTEPSTGGGGRSILALSGIAAVAASGTQIIKTTVARDTGTGAISVEKGRCALSWIIFPGASTVA